MVPISKLLVITSTEGVALKGLKIQKLTPHVLTLKVQKEFNDDIITEEHAYGSKERTQQQRIMNAAAPAAADSKARDDG